MELAIVAMVAGGAAALFGYLMGASFLRKGEARLAHLLMWGSIIALLVLGMLIQHDWAPFLLLVGFVLVGQAATEIWRLRRAGARNRRR